jgi:hypothetical protein
MSDSSLISREQALAVIGEERLRLLAECQQHGWLRWAAIRGTEAGSILSASARARIVYDGTVQRARQVFPAGMCGQKHGLLILDMGGVLTRFKKLDEELIPRGIPTGQALMFEEQAHLFAEQMTLFPPAPMLIVGYVVDELGLGIRRQVLVLRRNGEVIWEHDLVFGEGEGQIPIPITPGPTRGPAPAEVHSARSLEEDRKEAQ